MPEADALKKTIDELDKRHSWHAYTQMQEYLQIPQMHITHGKGCWLYDIEGKRYLDANASIWTNVHGHNDADLNSAFREQLDKVAHSTWLGLSHPIGCQLAERIIKHTPDNLARVVFSDNGSTAIETALKLSFQYWQLVDKPKKKCVINMQGAYHGDTFGAMAAGDKQGFHQRFTPWLFQTRSFPTPICCEYGGAVYKADATESLAQLETTLKAEADQIACLIIEPSIQGAAGMRLQPPGFLRRIESLCRHYNIHLILDEVFVGFGRSGSMLVSRTEGIKPDFLCLAKGITGGYFPLAATLTSETVYQAFLGPFESYRAFFHGHTFSANPLGAAVALKSIKKLESLIQSRQLLRTVRTFSAAVRYYLANHPRIREIRQRGLAAAVDLYPGVEGESYPIEQRTGLKVCIAARRNGLLLRPLNDSIILVPPLVIQADEINFLLSNLVKTIDSTLT